MSASSVQNATSTAVETEWANFPIPASPKNEINDNESTSSSASRKYVFFFFFWFYFNKVSCYKQIF